MNQMENFCFGQSSSVCELLCLVFRNGFRKFDSLSFPTIISGQPNTAISQFKVGFFFFLIECCPIVTGGDHNWNRRALVFTATLPFLLPLYDSLERVAVKAAE